MKSRSCYFFCLILVSIAVMRCTEKSTKPEEAEFTSISILPGDCIIGTGQTKQLTCIAHYSDESTETVSAESWSVSPGVCGTIDSTGLFSAHATATGIEVMTAAYPDSTARMTIEVTDSGTMVDNESERLDDIWTAGWPAAERCT